MFHSTRCVSLGRLHFAQKAVFHSARCVSLGRLCFAPMLRTLSGSPAVLLLSPPLPPHLICIATIHDEDSGVDDIDDQPKKQCKLISGGGNFLLFCPNQYGPNFGLLA